MKPIIDKEWKALAIAHTERVIISIRKREKISISPYDCLVCIYMEHRGVLVEPFPCDCPALDMCRKFCRIIGIYRITRAGIRALKAHIKELEK